MKIQMLVSVSGTRADGQPWPPAGGCLSVADWEAEHLIAGNMARAAEAATDTSAEGHGGEPGEAASPAPPEAAPKSYAPKADWVAWAVACGASGEAAASSSKAELMEMYGERS